MRLDDKITKEPYDKKYEDAKSRYKNGEITAMNKLKTVPNGEMIIYENSDGKTNIDVRFDEETLWLTQMQMADLFGVQKAAISKH